MVSIAVLFVQEDTDVGAENQFSWVILIAIVYYFGSKMKLTTVKGCASDGFLIISSSLMFYCINLKIFLLTRFTSVID